MTRVSKTYWNEADSIPRTLLLILGILVEQSLPLMSRTSVLLVLELPANIKIGLLGGGGGAVVGGANKSNRNRPCCGDEPETKNE